MRGRRRSLRGVRRPTVDLGPWLELWRAGERQRVLDEASRATGYTRVELFDALTTKDEILVDDWRDWLEVARALGLEQTP